MTTRITRAEIEELRWLHAVLSPPVEVYARNADADDWAVGSVGRGYWDIVDITEERARSIAALLNALPALLDAADERNRLEALRVGIMAKFGELHEHLALMVRYLEEETSQGDGIAEEHFDGYQAAKSVLARTVHDQPQWENAQVEIHELMNAAEERDRLSDALRKLVEAIVDHGHGPTIDDEVSRAREVLREAELACGQAVVKRETPESE